MKLLLTLLLLPLLTYSQVRISSEVDLRNIILGSDLNNSTYNGTFTLGYRIDNVQFQATYETFKEIEYENYSLHVGLVFNQDSKLNYVALVGIGMIERHVSWLHNVWYPSMLLSGQMEYHMGSFFLTARPELNFRGDLDRVVFSGFLGIGFNIL